MFYENNMFLRSTKYLISIRTLFIYSILIKKIRRTRIKIKKIRKTGIIKKTKKRISDLGIKNEFKVLETEKRRKNKLLEERSLRK